MSILVFASSIWWKCRPKSDFSTWFLTLSPFVHFLAHNTVFEGVFDYASKNKNQLNSFWKLFTSFSSFWRIIPYTRENHLICDIIIAIIALTLILTKKITIFCFAMLWAIVIDQNSVPKSSLGPNKGVAFSEIWVRVSSNSFFCCRPWWLIFHCRINVLHSHFHLQQPFERLINTFVNIVDIPSDDIFELPSTFSYTSSIVVSMFCILFSICNNRLNVWSTHL